MSAERKELHLMLRHSWESTIEIETVTEIVLLAAVISGIENSFDDYTIRQRVIAYALNVYYHPPADFKDRFKLHLATVKYAIEYNEKKFFMSAAKLFGT